MARRKRGEPVHGWVNFDKPLHMTSTQAVGHVRRLLNAEKAGHAGTLDPLATGILPIALGEATKTIPFVQNAGKIYRFTVQWGIETDSCDRDGSIVAESPHRPSESAIRDILLDFIGEIEQVPPVFSAIKINGQRAYDLARDGQEVEMTARHVLIDRLDLIECPDSETAIFDVACSKGTYVRALARDISQALGTCGHVIALRRLAVGNFLAEDAISLDFSTESCAEELHRHLLPVMAALDDIPAMEMTEEEANRLRHGNPVLLLRRHDLARLNAVPTLLSDDEDDGHMPHALALCAGHPIALIRIDGAEIRPVRVLNL